MTTAKYPDTDAKTDHSLSATCYGVGVASLPEGKSLSLYSSVYTRPLTRILIRIKLIRVRVNTLIRIAIWVT